MKVFMSEYSIHQKAPPEFIPQGGRGFRGLPNIFSHNAVIHLNTKKTGWYAPGRLAQQKAYSDDSPAVRVKMT